MMFLSLLTAAAAASTVLTPRVRAERTPSPPVLDGRLDDRVWQRASRADGFTQKFPDEAAPPSEATSFRVLYDDDAIYIAVDCEQRLTPVRAVLTRRDREVEADRVSIHIGGRQGEASAFSFGVNAAGVLSDALQFDDNRVAPEWDENWEAATSQHPGGWSAELRIPLRVLRFEGAATQDWAFNVRRVISLRQEIDEWAFIPRTEAGEVSRYGRVENLENLLARRRFELRPFVLGRLTHRQPGFAPVSGFSPGVAAGIDLKWQVLPQLTLEATALPDFGQVEVDQVVLNLSTIETFYPEKRPFFSEGLDLFVTPLSLLHTRRIGATPGRPSLLPDERVRGVIDPSPIYGAFKLTGRAAAGLDLGIISAVTGENTVPVARPDGSSIERIAAPMTSYNVLRLRQRIGSGARLGLLATAVNRRERGGYPNVEFRTLRGFRTSRDGLGQASSPLAHATLRPRSGGQPAVEPGEGLVLHGGTERVGLVVEGALEAFTLAGLAVDLLQLRDSSLHRRQRVEGVARALLDQQGAGGAQGGHVGQIERLVEPRDVDHPGVRADVVPQLEAELGHPARHAGRLDPRIQADEMGGAQAAE
jgi:Domain of unknown function (DUF5916)/Carbohydrate family 9 binding domain-like